MSRILRRPMFRGGGPVNSYGTGITAPLVPGYEGGGQIGGGIIYGIPHTDGRYGFQTPNVVPTIGGDLTLGSELLRAANQKLRAPAPYKLPPGVATEPKDTSGSGAEIQDLDFSEMNTDFDQVKQVTLDDGSTVMVNVDSEDVKPSATTQFMWDGDYEKFKKNKALEDIALEKEKTRIENVGKEPIDTSGNKLPPSLRNLNKEIPDLNTNLGEGAEEPVVDAKTMMEENAELFKEMLGIKKARGQDISDMLLRFSGSKGNTLGEKFQNYTALEAAAGPGRAEQIGKTAAGLSIQDYVAGKRAKEAVDLMKSKVDYEYGKKGEIVNVQKTDNATEALLKIGKKGDVKPNSDAAIKYLVGIADDRSDVFSVNQKGLMKKIGENPAKAMKQLKNGVNIVRDGGQIAIVITDGNNITEIFDSVSEYWNANK